MPGDERSDKRDALDRQRDELARDFRDGLTPKGDKFTPRMLELVRDAIEQGRSRYDPLLVQAVRDGAQPGDPLPAALLEPKPFITGALRRRGLHRRSGG